MFMGNSGTPVHNNGEMPGRRSLGTSLVQRNGERRCRLSCIPFSQQEGWKVVVYFSGIECLLYVALVEGGRRGHAQARQQGKLVTYVSWGKGDGDGGPLMGVRFYSSTPQTVPTFSFPRHGAATYNILCRHHGCSSKSSLIVLLDTVAVHVPWRCLQTFHHPKRILPCCLEREGCDMLACSSGTPPVTFCVQNTTAGMLELSLA